MMCSHLTGTKPFGGGIANMTAKPSAQVRETPALSPRAAKDQPTIFKLESMELEHGKSGQSFCRSDILLGAVHGFLVTKVRMQPFVVTLCGLLIYRGVARC